MEESDLLAAKRCSTSVSTGTESVWPSLECWSDSRLAEADEAALWLDFWEEGEVAMLNGIGEKKRKEGRINPKKLLGIWLMHDS
jgi:hypothetical protein